MLHPERTSLRRHADRSPRLERHTRFKFTRLKLKRPYGTAERFSIAALFWREGFMKKPEASND